MRKLTWSLIPLFILSTTYAVDKEKVSEQIAKTKNKIVKVAKNRCKKTIQRDFM